MRSLLFLVLSIVPTGTGLGLKKPWQCTARIRSYQELLHP
ncbi:hypothetical protein BRCON_1313 [Candidatus Sumerlaea chitinivorans]|uniref:Uncharacterized protein n=1 Tax=Sumerlaea chitinivorans TaxID=2250252 RepID=A0A2Z4Y4M3_SUMC1|nr:hypothetical protein BRCON_1313 [Candidatus Sumerlaea chitinivorans]